MSGQMNFNGDKEQPVLQNVFFLRHWIQSKIIQRITTFSLVYTITILHRLLIYPFMKHSLLQTFEKALALQSLDTLSDVRIKVFTLLF
jgi:hypothetical protein